MPIPDNDEPIPGFNASFAELEDWLGRASLAAEEGADADAPAPSPAPPVAPAPGPAAPPAAATEQPEGRAHARRRATAEAVDVPRRSSGDIQRYYLCSLEPSGEFVEVIVAVTDGGRRRYFSTQDGARLTEVDEDHFDQHLESGGRSLLELDEREMAELEAELRFVRPVRGRDPLAEVEVPAAGPGSADAQPDSVEPDAAASDAPTPAGSADAGGATGADADADLDEPGADIVEPDAEEPNADAAPKRSSFAPAPSPWAAPAPPPTFLVPPPAVAPADPAGAPTAAPSPAADVPAARDRRDAADGAAEHTNTIEENDQVATGTTTGPHERLEAGASAPVTDQLIQGAPAAAPAPTAQPAAPAQAAAAQPAVAQPAALTPPAAAQPAVDAAAQVALAKGIAFVAHRGQLDRTGAEYIDHPGRVAERFDAATEPIETAAAWLHDVLEDTAVTAQDLLEAGVQPEVLEVVHLLTRRPEVADDEYYARIRRHPQARRVKLADIDDNAAPWRLRKLDHDTQVRLVEKYRHAREQLAGA
ncbi:hypothetical protein ABIQ69_02850 [Agromyces sp. G08B096]|uniref:HD domain-containing protein n=1 Tax=Agromyces sp. G08B096 TaxID=3156399 RepID=A0AAU7W8S9_9MICO